MRKILRNVITLSLGIALVFACPGVAHADDETATTMARERFKEGVAHFDQKQYDKARVAFLQAYALKKHPAVLLNLAQSELRSGHEADAAKHFSMFLREAKEATPAEREGAEAGLFACKAVVGEIALQVDADGATVLVDGKEEGLTPLPDPLYLTPGTHQIEVRKESAVANASVTAKAGEASELSLSLASSSSGSGAAPPPRAEGAPPSRAEEEEPASSGGREPFFSWVGHTPLAWVGGGLTVAGIAGGIGFGLGAKQNYDDADAVASQIRTAAREDGTNTQGICTDPRTKLASAPNVVNLDARVAEYQAACLKQQDNADEGDTMKTLSIVSWAVAGAAAIGTVVYYFVDTKPGSETVGRTDSPRVSVGAFVTPGQGVLSVQGSF